MLKISRLSFQYPQDEFKLVVPSLQVSPGETLAIIGPSGCGKTTLLHLIAGIKLPSSGEIEFEGRLITSLTDADRRRFRITTVGFIFQDFELLDYLNVLDNILHPYRLNPALKLTPKICDRAICLAEQLGIGDKLRRHINHLSQGERQRVAICRALLPEPKLLLADEATGNLDPANKYKVLDSLFEYVEKQPATLVAATHDTELLSHFDRVIDFRNFSLAPSLE
ncbi:MAG: ABC transporter ATP-binding protein [Cyanobacteria bacterium P01_H01_bin.15]